MPSADRYQTWRVSYWAESTRRVGDAEGRQRFGWRIDAPRLRRIRERGESHQQLAIARMAGEARDRADRRQTDYALRPSIQVEQLEPIAGVVHEDGREDIARDDRRGQLVGALTDNHGRFAARPLGLHGDDSAERRALVCLEEQSTIGRLDERVRGPEPFEQRFRLRLRSLAIEKVNFALVARALAGRQHDPPIVAGDGHFDHDLALIGTLEDQPILRLDRRRVDGSTPC